MSEEMLEYTARDIAKKFGCTDWQGLAIAVQMQQNATLEDIAYQIRNYS